MEAKQLTTVILQVICLRCSLPNLPSQSFNRFFSVLAGNKYRPSDINKLPVTSKTNKKKRCLSTVTKTMPPSLLHFPKFTTVDPEKCLHEDEFTLKSNCKVSHDVVLKSTECLLNGGVIAVPTDTVYGVACLAQNTDAINRIYAIKNRNFQNPVAISVANVEDIAKWSNVTVCEELLHSLLPGPVTVVFERKPNLNPLLNPLTNLVGVRIPKNWFMQELAKKCGGPIALTSANLSGTKSCLQIQEFENLWSQLDIVVDGGQLSDTEESRLGSTVVDLSQPHTFRIIRPGSAHKGTVQILKKFGLQESQNTQ